MTKNPIIHRTHWVEADPTAGCLIVVNKPFYEGSPYIMRLLNAALLNAGLISSPLLQGIGGTLQSDASLADSRHITQSRNEQVGDTIVVRINFNQNEVVQLIKITGSSLELLFTPYVQAVRTVPGILAVGIGFNLLYPASLDEASFCEAGVTLLFTCAANSKSWARQAISPMADYHA